LSVQFRKHTSGLIFVATVMTVATALAAAAAWRILGPHSASPAPQTTTVASGPSAERRTDSAISVRPGGSLVGSVRAEPRTFNRYVINGQTEETVAFLTQAKLVRINRATDEVEPWLAESWEQVSRQSTVGHSATANPESRIPSPETGPIFRVKLRPGVTFSDGAPFTSADVLFAFEAVYDPRVKSALATALRVGSRPLAVRALGDHEVEVAFPSPYGPGMRLLDALWILPKHKLAPALRAGTLGQAWSLTTPASEMAGLGPFVLREYRPGERMVFERNPRYWRRDALGRPLPYLDRLTLEMLPDQAAELLRLQSSQLDFTHTVVRSEDYVTLKRAHDEGRVRLVDLGVSFDTDWFWFNLAASQQPTANSRRPSAVSRQRSDKPWLRAREFREAVSLVVDRKAYTDAVFLGAAVPVHGPVTPGNTIWYWPELPGGEYDPARAKRLLAGLGLTDRNGDGMLEDAQGRPARFTVLLQRGIAGVEKGAAFIRDELATIGVGLDPVGLDAGGIFARWGAGDYEAIFHRLNCSDTDPGACLDFWLSSGGTHVWNPSQPAPATDWEQRIDDLMHRQAASSDRAERVRVFREVQRIFSEQLPIVHFAAPRMFLATSTRLTNATPSRLIPLILWNAETLAVSSNR